MDLWVKNDDGDHYFRRIDVGAKCLGCHGPKNSRPDFIKKKYGPDRAFDFKVGDLRGLYHVKLSKRTGAQTKK